MTLAGIRHNTSRSKSGSPSADVRDKIRQQLQVLRDMGFLEFLGGGRYRAV
jgi:hypothetical protein